MLRIDPADHKGIAKRRGRDAKVRNGRTVIDADLFDLNHAEVLRGPQGTLYGSGSMGGTIKLVTNLPKFDT
jgi:iron complex outermembrane receptor protein